MNDLDKRAFSEALLAMGAAFNREVDKPLARAFWYACNDLPLEAVLKAVHGFIRQGGHWMPTPAELRQKAMPRQVWKEPQAWIEGAEARDKSLGEWRALPPLRERMRNEWLALPAMQEPQAGEDDAQ